jgi:hypothetical protein
MGMGSQRHAPAALPPGNGPDTHCVGGCVDLRAGLDMCGKPCIRTQGIELLKAAYDGVYLRCLVWRASGKAS